MVDGATVKLWGQTVGYIRWQTNDGYAAFEYEPEFLETGLDICPIHMSIDDARRGEGVFSFPALREEVSRTDTFLGLPGLLADCLPDKFGNRLIDAWLARSGWESASFTPVERLCYMGTRGMGALEFMPGNHPADLNKSNSVEIDELVKLAQDIMDLRRGIGTGIAGNTQHAENAIMELLRVGTSAGGARPKAVIAMNAKERIRSGQVRAPKGYDYWILKFDGVTDEQLGAPRGYGRLEYAYYLMARQAGIEIAESRLLEENSRAHFMTRRFDRKDNQKIHRLSLCGIAHFDFNEAGAYSYEQAFAVMRALKDLGLPAFEQQYRRTLFNVIARNQDDHTKNISFLMEPDGVWKLSPAYDVTYSFNPKGAWTNVHQMSLAGKRDNFTLRDLIGLGEYAGIRKPKQIIQEIQAAVLRWPEFAGEAGVPDDQITKVGNVHRKIL